MNELLLDGKTGFWPKRSVFGRILCNCAKVTDKSENFGISTESAFSSQVDYTELPVFFRGAETRSALASTLSFMDSAGSGI